MQDTEKRRRMTRRGFLGAAAGGAAATTVLRARVEARPAAASDAERLIRLVERYGSELGRVRKVG